MKTFVLIVIFLLVFGAGFAIGRLTVGDHPGDNIENASAEKMAHAEGIESGQTTAENQRDGACRQELLHAKEKLAAWEAKAKMQGWILGNAQEALSEYEKSEDEPVEWDEATPQKYRKSTFESVITASVEQSNAGIEYVDVRCEEEPCVAMLRVPDADTAKSPWLRKLQGTPAWSETYDKLISLRATTVKCGDGSTESVALLSKDWKEMPDAHWLHVNKRRDKRLGALLKNWKCRGER